MQRHLRVEFRCSALWAELQFGLYGGKCHGGLWDRESMRQRLQSFYAELSGVGEASLWKLGLRVWYGRVDQYVEQVRERDRRLGE